MKSLVSLKLLSGIESFEVNDNVSNVFSQSTKHTNFLTLLKQTVESARLKEVNHEAMNFNLENYQWAFQPDGRGGKVDLHFRWSKAIRAAKQVLFKLNPTDCRATYVEIYQNIFSNFSRRLLVITGWRDSDADAFEQCDYGALFYLVLLFTDDMMDMDSRFKMVHTARSQVIRGRQKVGCLGWHAFRYTNITTGSRNDVSKEAPKLRHSPFETAWILRVASSVSYAYRMFRTGDLVFVVRLEEQHQKLTFRIRAVLEMIIDLNDSI